MLKIIQYILIHYIKIIHRNRNIENMNVLYYKNI